MAGKGKPPADDSPAPIWFDRALALHAANNLFAHFLDLPCNAVLKPGRRGERWLQLGDSRRPQELLHFESHYRPARTRQDYNRRSFKAVQRRARVLLGRYGVHADLFVWLPGEGALVLGPFLPRLPTRDALARHFQALSGKTASGHLPEFIQYCRVALATPLLEPPARAAVGRALLALARYSSGRIGAADLHRSLRKLEQGALSRELPFRAAGFVAARRRGPLGDQRWQPPLQRWDTEELGVYRPPRFALAVAPAPAWDGGLDEVDSLLREARLRLKLFRAARRLPDTVAGPLEGGGVLLLTGLSGGESRRPLRSVFQALAEELRRRLGEPLHMGVGGLNHGPDAVALAMDEAVLALRQARADGRLLAHFEDLGRAGAAGAFGRAAAWLERLAEALAAGDAAGLRSAAGEYLRLARAHAGGHVAVLRAHLLHALRVLLAQVERRAVLPPAELRGLGEAWEHELEAAGLERDLRAAFLDRCLRLGSLLAAPGASDRQRRLEQARLYVRQNCEQALSLTRVARRAGFSPSRFSRLFKQAVGVDFRAYLLQARLERARELLRAGELPVYQVALEVGFNSPSHFVQAFRKAQGITPAEYRRRAR